MAVARPLQAVALRAHSNVEDLALVALIDASAVLQQHAEDVDVRLIGGLMMEVHRLRWGLGPDLVRETRDADFGAPLLAAAVFEDVELGLENLGYRLTGPHRYERVVKDVPVDVPGRAPNYVATLDLVQVRAVPLNALPMVEVGSGELDPVAIVEALSRPAVEVRLDLTRRNDASTSIAIRVADEASAVILKAYAWRARASPRDIHDLWRSLEIANAAGSRSVDLTGPAGRATADILSDAFDDPSGEPVRLLASSTRMSSDVIHTRVSALRNALGL
jgi:hypothetical protein